MRPRTLKLLAPPQALVGVVLIVATFPHWLAEVGFLVAVGSVATLQIGTTRAEFERLRARMRE